MGGRGGGSTGVEGAFGGRESNGEGIILLGQIARCGIGCSSETIIHTTRPVMAVVIWVVWVAWSSIFRVIVTFDGNV